MAPFTERPAADLKASFASHGFTFTNALWPYQAFASRFDQTVADSQTLGLKTIVCSPRPRLRTTDDWKSMADELNKYGERTKAAGLQLGYHNHEIEFVKTPQGDAPWDILVQATDPALVQFLLDVGNCVFGGGDPYAYLDKYKTRYYGVHVKDLKPGKAAVPVGSGDLDWTRIFTLVKAAGIRNIVAEVGAYGAQHAPGTAARPAGLQRAGTVQTQRRISQGVHRGVGTARRPCRNAPRWYCSAVCSRFPASPGSRPRKLLGQRWTSTTSIPKGASPPSSSAPPANRCSSIPAMPADAISIRIIYNAGVEHNAAGAFIANVDDNETIAGVLTAPPAAAGRQGGARGGGAQAHVPAHWLLVSASRDGSFTVTNPRNGFSKTYAATGR